MRWSSSTTRTCGALSGNGSARRATALAADVACGLIGHVGSDDRAGARGSLDQRCNLAAIGFTDHREQEAPKTVFPKTTNIVARHACDCKGVSNPLHLFAGKSPNEIVAFVGREKQSLAAVVRTRLAFDPMVVDQRFQHPR